MYPANKALTTEDSVTFSTMLHNSIVGEHCFNVDITSTLADARKLVITNPIHIINFSQVIDNLASSVIKFSPPDSCIWIKTDLNDTHFRLQVIDSGLSRSDSDDLFQPFCKLSAKSKKGEKQTGLDLSIAKSVVEAHGGETSFKRTAHGHSRFVVDVVFSPS